MKIWNIGRSVRSVADVFDSTKYVRLNDRHDYDIGIVNPISIYNHNFYYCGCRVGWHEDDFEKQYFANLVIKNPNQSWVQCKGYPLRKDQPAGTIVVFDSWKEHKLACSKKGMLYDAANTYVFAAFQYDEEPTDSLVNRQFNELIDYFDSKQFSGAIPQSSHVAIPRQLEVTMS